MRHGLGLGQSGGGGGGSSFNPAAPGPIGGTTPAAITGTTITATTGFVGGTGAFTGITDSGNLALNSATGQISLGVSGDSIITAPTTNSFRFGTVAASTVNSRTELNKQVSAIADNTLTPLATVTIPNGAHSASIRVRLKGAVGAGGAIGADEATKSVEYDIDITRTPGVAAVANIGGAYGGTAAGASVAGGAVMTIVGALSAMAGAVGATNTFTINGTLDAVTGAATNHTCFVYIELLNDNASGVTVA